MKITLTLDVEFDPAVTTAEAVAEALDILLSTAISTEGVLDDCGDVQVGNFNVSD